MQIKFIKDNICELELHYYFYFSVVYKPVMKISDKKETYFTESNAKNVFEVLKSKGIDFE